MLHQQARAGRGEGNSQDVTNRESARQGGGSAPGRVREREPDGRLHRLTVLLRGIEVQSIGRLHGGLVSLGPRALDDLGVANESVHADLQAQDDESRPSMSPGRPPFAARASAIAAGSVTRDSMVVVPHACASSSINGWARLGTWLPGSGELEPAVAARAVDERPDGAAAGQAVASASAGAATLGCVSSSVPSRRASSRQRSSRGARSWAHLPAARAARSSARSRNRPFRSTPPDRAARGCPLPGRRRAAPSRRRAPPGGTARAPRRRGRSPRLPDSRPLLYQGRAGFTSPGPAQRYGEAQTLFEHTSGSGQTGAADPDCGSRCRTCPHPAAASVTAKWLAAACAWASVYISQTPLTMGSRVSPTSSTPRTWTASHPRSAACRRNVAIIASVGTACRCGPAGRPRTGRRRAKGAPAPCDEYVHVRGVAPRKCTRR